jgi:hypothetical protein
MFSATKGTLPDKNAIKQPATYNICIVITLTNKTKTAHERL